MIRITTIEAEIEAYKLPHICLFRDLSYFDCHLLSILGSLQRETR